MDSYKMVSPDGGWGWIVVIGSCIINLSTRSIEPSFGILFNDILKDLKISTTGASVIMSTLDAIINFSGLFVGPLIKKFSYRKVGIFGGFLSCAALISTSYANSMAHLIITYGIIGGLGFGLATASTFIAVNAYFEKKRGQAIGLSMAGTAFGFMAMPQLISRLLEVYNFRGTVFILGAISLNTVVGSALLQPVKWHRKPVKKIPVVLLKQLSNEEISSVEEPIPTADNKYSKNNDTIRVMENDQEVSQSLLGLNKQNLKNVRDCQTSMTNLTTSQNNLNTTDFNDSFLTISHKKKMVSNMSLISNIDISGNIFYSGDQIICNRGINKNLKYRSDLSINYKSREKNKETSKYWKQFSNLMDLDLLKDYVYLNILFGTSINYVAELNFKLIIPFFMEDLTYSKQQTATALSIMAIADISARVLVPLFTDRFEFPKRKLLMIGCVAVALARSILAEQTQWMPILIVITIHGFFRGFCLINFPVVIAEHVPVEKFAAAYGLSMVVKGIFIIFLGPLPGYIRDVTNSYKASIHVQSLMIMICVIAWSIEAVFF